MKIVVVEDEKVIREGMGKILKKLNASYEVAGLAEDGQKGLELIRIEKPDLIIMDIQMPIMDGLTMLTELRKEGCLAKVIVLTAYSDFGYAKQAIELGIENYLLKPIKVPDLKKTLLQIEAKIEKDRENMYSLERILREYLSGQADVNRITQSELAEYQLREETDLHLGLLWLGRDYKDNVERVKEELEKLVKMAANEQRIIKILDFPGRLMLVVVSYGLIEEEDFYRFMQRKTVPQICDAVEGQVICVAEVCKGLGNLHGTLESMLEEMEWNLLLGRGVLISLQKISHIRTVPFKYPSDLENHARQAVIHGSQIDFERSFKQFIDLCRAQIHNPKEIKEGCIRYCWNVLNVLEEMEGYRRGVSIEQIIRLISEANEWGEIKSALTDFFQEAVLQERIEENSTGGILIQRAKQMIQEFYSEGITLEETARKLHVSVEHLSTTFKKETGFTFSETIRKYRILKVKSLLTETDLKLNQIADMVGYSDPKYMSKVFKEEEGVLPAEYRKLNVK